MRRMMTSMFFIVCLLQTSGAQNQLCGELSQILDRCSQTINQPSGVSQGFFTMDHSPIMGNGCLMVTVGSSRNGLKFYIGKTDYWRDRCFEDTNDGWQSANVLPGMVDITLLSFNGAGFRQTLDLKLAEVRTEFTGEHSRIRVTSLTAHPADNCLINEVENQGLREEIIEISTKTEQYRIASNPFNIAAGVNSGKEPVAWVTRLTNKPPHHEQFGSGPFRMWAAIGTKVSGAYPVSLQTDNEWSHTTGDLAVGSTLKVILKPGQKVIVLTYVGSTGLPITPDPFNPLPDVLKTLKRQTGQTAREMITKHRSWWTDYWEKSYVSLPEEPLVERVYYGALYVFGCANKPGQWPAGCNGWPVDDAVPWGGDYHWNYNNQAVYYGAFSSNRTELTEPYDRTVNEANVFGKRHAEKLGVPGTVFFVATAPGHLNEAQTIDQRTHAIEASLIQINHWYYTLDTAWLKSNYQFLRDVADYWDHDLSNSREYRPDGSYRYVVRNSAPMEGAVNDRFNGITGIAFLKRFFKAMADITESLNKAGYPTGRGADDISRWNDYLLRMSDYPMSFAFGRKVFAWSEQSLNPLLTEQDWILYPVFPAEQVGLGSDPKLLEIARNTLIIKPQYYVEWLNNPTQIFSIAARLAHHPPEILERFRTYYSGLGISNFRSGGSNTEGTAIIESVNSFLLQSQDERIRLFPCWDARNASFTRLRTTGAFLVTGEKKDGLVLPVKIFSEKGADCRLVSPWADSEVRIFDREGRNIGYVYASEDPDPLIIFHTRAGEEYLIEPVKKYPEKIPYRNAALYAKVAVSSDFRPAESNLLFDKKKLSEMARLDTPAPVYSSTSGNWSADKLTDGTRINTQAGHRGWTSDLHDTPDASEWVLIDLGEPVAIGSVDLWPLDHGDAWQHTHCTEPFVNSGEIDQSYDGFPLSFAISVSQDGKEWQVAGKFEQYALPASNVNLTEQKPKDVTGPERFDLNGRMARYIRLDASKLRKTRYFGKYALQLAEIEVIRQ